jgi:hypothetical protein
MVKNLGGGSLYVAVVGCKYKTVAILVIAGLETYFDNNM